MKTINELSYELNGAAIDVHRALGPGLLESAYEAAFCHELALRGIRFVRQKNMPVVYKDTEIDCGYRIDVLAEGQIVIELKAVEKLLPLHEAQLLTYLKLSHLPLGLLINFNVPVLKDGIRRLVNHLAEPSALSASSAVKT
ncbi:MAG TPA: GxxExxY protein [Opitutaceae bacterium]|nr:GxxExxY protein [Opitutaceae bacterium]